MTTKLKFFKIILWPCLNRTIVRLNDNFWGMGGNREQGLCNYERNHGTIGKSSRTVKEKRMGEGGDGLIRISD